MVGSATLSTGLSGSGDYYDPDGSSVHLRAYDLRKPPPVAALSLFDVFMLDVLVMLLCL